MQMLWLAAGLLFTFAVIRSTSGEDSSTRELLNKGYNAVTGGASSVTGGGRLNAESDRVSLKEAMMLAERSWAKDVKKRHDMIAKDYGNVSKMPL